MIGVLLINLGTPDAPTPPAVRRYLREFLSDRRVVELPPLLWRPLLYGVIAPARAGRVAALYRKIWDPEGADAPLRLITRRLAEALDDRLAVLLGRGRVRVAYAMRYGRPAIGAALDRLVDDGADRILIAPLYPQYAAATTASALDAAARWLTRRRALPALRSLPPYYDDPAYIAALAESLRAAISEEDRHEAHVLCSFHGLPMAQVEAGDPYPRQCEATAAALRDALDWPASRFHVTYQSRFGPAAWLEPASDLRAVELARAGVRRLVVIAPGFAADCLETLEELDGALKAAFEEAGGEAFVRVPCLNDTARHVELMERLVLRELAGWL